MVKLTDMVKVPESLQGILWSRNVSNLDIKKDKHYIIHQILAYGTWEHLRWLFKIYKRLEIKDVFLENPEKDYTEEAFNFVKNILLDLDKNKVDKRQYVKTYPRLIR